MIEPIRTSWPPDDLHGEGDALDGEEQLTTLQTLMKMVAATMRAVNQETTKKHWTAGFFLYALRLALGPGTCPARLGGVQ